MSTPAHYLCTNNLFEAVEKVLSSHKWSCCGAAQIKLPCAIWVLVSMNWAVYDIACASALRFGRASMS